MHICWSKVTDGASSLGLDEGWCGNAGVTWERIVQPDFWPNLLDQVRIRKSCGRPVCRRLGWRSPWNQKLLLRFRLGHDMHVCNLLSPSMPRHSGKCTFIENCLQAADIDDELEKEMEKELESFLEEEKRLEEEVGKVSEQEARARAAAAMKALEVEPTQKCGHDDAPTEAYSQGIPEEACDVQHPAKRQRMDAAGEDEVLSASQEADMDELLKLQEEQLQLERQIEEKRAKKEEQKRLAQAAAEAAEKARQEALLKEQQQEEERRQEEKRRKRGECWPASSSTAMSSGSQAAGHPGPASYINYVLSPAHAQSSCDGSPSCNCKSASPSRQKHSRERSCSFSRRTEGCYASCFALHALI